MSARRRLCATAWALVLLALGSPAAAAAERATSAETAEPLAIVLEPDCACVAYPQGLLDLRRLTWQPQRRTWAASRSRDACHVTLGSGHEVEVWDCRSGRKVTHVRVPRGVDDVVWIDPASRASLYLHSKRRGWWTPGSTRRPLAGRPGLTRDRRHTVVVRCPAARELCVLELRSLGISSSGGPSSLGVAETALGAPTRIRVGNIQAALLQRDRRCRGRRRAVWGQSPDGRVLWVAARLRDKTCGGTMCALSLVDLATDPPRLLHASSACAVEGWRPPSSVALRGFDGSGFTRERVTLDLSEKTTPPEPESRWRRPEAIAQELDAGWSLTLRLPSSRTDGPAVVIRALVRGGATLRALPGGAVLSVGDSPRVEAARASMAATLRRILGP